MPQMAPMLWLCLFLYFVVLFLFFIINLYFVSLPVSISSSCSGRLESFKFSWLW